MVIVRQVLLAALQTTTSCAAEQDAEILARKHQQSVGSSEGKALEMKAVSTRRFPIPPHEWIGKISLSFED